jgi:hypothetical protein
MFDEPFLRESRAYSFLFPYQQFFISPSFISHSLYIVAIVLAIHNTFHYHWPARLQQAFQIHHHCDRALLIRCYHFSPTFDSPTRGSGYIQREVEWSMVQMAMTAMTTRS